MIKTEHNAERVQKKRFQIPKKHGYNSVFVLIINILLLFTQASGMGKNASEKLTGLLFKADYDAYNVNATVACGAKKPLNFANPDLQLRMFPGALKSTNALVLTGNENCCYNAFKNINPQEGTVSFWVQPLNWKASSDKFVIFFDASLPQMQLIVYKYVNPNYICFYLSSGTGATKKHRAVFYRVEDDDWKSNTWHKIDAVWTERSMALYIDGRLRNFPGHGKQRKAYPKADFNSQPLTLPRAPAKGIMKLNNNKFWKHDPKVRTAYDELCVYGKPLSEDQIMQRYLMECPKPTTRNTAEKMFVTLPFTRNNVTIDGRLETDEWKDAGEIPVLMPFNAQGTKAYADVFVKYDRENLLVGVKVAASPDTGKEYTTHDSKVYFGDCFEIHLRPSDNVASRQYQFIVNPFGGSYDSRNNDLKWNSNMRSVSRRKDGSWEAEIAIPLRNLGNPLPGSIWTGNFCIAARSPRLAYVSWSPVIGGFGNYQGFGKLRWGKDEAAVRLENGNSLRHGKFNRSQIKTAGSIATQVEGLPKPGTSATSTTQKIIITGQLPNRKTAFFYQWNTVVRLPLEITFCSRPDLGYIQTKLDFGNCSLQALRAINKGNLKGTLQLLDCRGAVISELKLNINKLQLPDIHLPLQKNMPPGNASICFKPAGSGFPELNRSISFRIPDMTPYRLKTAADHNVPPPWFPIKTNAAKHYLVLGRDYEFGDGPFPVIVRADGETVIDRAPQLLLTTAAAPQKIKWEKFHVVKRFQDYVSFAGKGSSQQFNLSWNGELWFDGMYRVDFQITPKKTITVNSLKLKWSVPQQFGKYILTPRFQPWDKQRLDLHWSTQETNSTVILQGIRKGLAWWNKSDANWLNRPGEKQISIIRRNGRTEATASIISLSAKLKKTISYTMTFMVTPGRTPPPEWRNYEMMTSRKDSSSLTCCGSWGSKIFPDDIAHAVSHIPRNSKTFKTFMNKRPDKFIAYTLPGHITRYDPEYDYFKEVWENNLAHRWPGKDKVSGEKYEAVACCGNTGVTDLIMYRLDRLLKIAPAMAGIYYDVCHVGACGNPLHGCGGTDAFGQKYTSSTALNLRTYLMRAYKLLHAHGKILINHAHNNFHPMVHNFSDYWVPGEELYYVVANNPFHAYCEDVPLEAYQSAWNSLTRGVGIIMLFQNTRVGTTHKPSKLQQGFLASEESAIRAYTPVLLHDIDPAGWWINTKFAARFFDMRSKLNLDQAKFHGYWFSSAVKSNSPKIYVSYYTWEKPAPWKIMLIVGNMGRKARPAALQIDARALKLATPIQTFELFGSNAPVLAEKLKTRMIPGNHFWLLGIK